MKFKNSVRSFGFWPLISALRPPASAFCKIICAFGPEIPHCFTVGQIRSRNENKRNQPLKQVQPMKTHIKNPFTCLGGASMRSRVLPALLAGLGLLLALPALVQAQFTFTTHNGAITITGYNTAAGLNVVIPAMTNGYPVTSIGVNAFQ